MNIKNKKACFYELQLTSLSTWDFFLQLISHYLHLTGIMASAQILHQCWLQQCSELAENFSPSQKFPSWYPLALSNTSLLLLLVFAIHRYDSLSACGSHHFYLMLSCFDFTFLYQTTLGSSFVCLQLLKILSLEYFSSKLALFYFCSYLLFNRCRQYQCHTKLTFCWWSMSSVSFSYCANNIFIIFQRK